MDTNRHPSLPFGQASADRFHWMLFVLLLLSRMGGKRAST